MVATNATTLTIDSLGCNAKRDVILYCFPIRIAIWRNVDIADRSIHCPEPARSNT